MLLLRHARVAGGGRHVSSLGYLRSAPTQCDGHPRGDGGGHLNALRKLGAVDEVEAHHLPATAALQQRLRKDLNSAEELHQVERPRSLQRRHP